MHSRSSFLVASDGGVAPFAENFRAWDPSPIDPTPGYAQCPSHAWSEASKLDPAALFPLSEFCARLIAAARTREIKDKMTLITRMANEGTEPAEAARRIGRSIAVHESMPFASAQWQARFPTLISALRPYRPNGGGNWRTACILRAWRRDSPSCGNRQRNDR